MKHFEYFEPTSVDEALSMLNQWKGDAKIIAGGTDLIPLMRDKLVAPKRIIDINKLSELEFMKETSEGIEIGALTRLRTIETSPLIRERMPLLAEAAEQVGSIQVRNVGTMTGNLVNASPAADMAPSLLVLDAKVRTRKTGAKREIPLSEFFTGVRDTILGKDELVTDIFVHRILPHTGGAFLKVGKRNALIMSTASAASAITIEDNVIQSCRVALGGVAPTPIRVKKAEELLIGENATDSKFADAARAASDEVRPIASSRRHKRSTAQYRINVSGVLVKRTLQLARDRSLGRK